MSYARGSILVKHLRAIGKTRRMLTSASVGASYGKWSPRALNGWTFLNRIMPAFHVGIIPEADILHTVKVDV